MGSSRQPLILLTFQKMTQCFTTNADDAPCVEAGATGEVSGMVPAEIVGRVKSYPLKQTETDGETSGSPHVTASPTKVGGEGYPPPQAIEPEENSGRGLVSSYFEQPVGGTISINSHGTTVTVSDESRAVTISLEYSSSEDATTWLVETSEERFNSLTEALAYVGVQ